MCPGIGIALALASAGPPSGPLDSDPASRCAELRKYARTATAASLLRGRGKSIGVSADFSALLDIGRSMQTCRWKTRAIWLPRPAHEEKPI